MSDIANKLKLLRKNLRSNIRFIDDDIFQRHAIRKDFPLREICIFCGSTDNITIEHVLPKWVFENCPKKFHTIFVNKQKQTFNKTTIPACSNCNNNILSHLERQIIITTEKIAKTKSYTYEELEYLIYWLEIIDYKLQVYGTRTKYLKHAYSDYHEFMSILSIAAVAEFPSISVWRIFSRVRNAQRRLLRKSKSHRINSLIFVGSDSPHFNFINQMNDYVFISFPKIPLAVFYFVTKEFTNISVARKEALKIIRSQSDL